MMCLRIAFIGLLLLACISCSSYAQHNKEKIKEDSLYINEVEDLEEPDKVLHAEPLYIDLIRDLGARKGEKEWNIGLGLTDHGDFDKYTTLVEYEFAPIHRLGFEAELPFSLYYPQYGVKNGVKAPSSKLNSIKLATQYSFYVSEKNKTTMALGYIHEFELTEFNNYGKSAFFTGNIYNPFFIAAKRWKNNFHTLCYAGPIFSQHFGYSSVSVSYQINTNFHYMITGTRNFIGIEFNKSIAKKDFDMTIRPQMRLGIADNLLIGIITGIPIKRENERFSSFLRLIYEPKHKK